MTDKKLNVHIDEGDTFFTNEVSVNFNPIQFFADFKCVAPRVDLRTKEGEININIKHNVVAFDPYHATQIHKLLTESIQNYEKKFGKIEKPKQLNKIESKEEGKQEKIEAPIYFG
ncbi:MAG: DUF3467 domain-containing protein [Candidatus Nanoarchaeia archaeon]